MIDSYGREINYLRVSVTDLCNLRCKYCMPEQGIEKFPHGEILQLEEIETLVKVFVELGITKIRITGGEPLVRKNIMQLIKAIGEIKGVENLSITTNGILLKKYLRELKDIGIKGINISIDTLVKEKYREITRGGNLEEVMESLEEALKYNFENIKINTVLIESFNIDEIQNFVTLTEDKKIDVRFIELMPIGEASHWACNKMISSETILEKVPALKRIETDDKNSPAVYYKLPNAKGKIGLISSISCKFCNECNRLRLTSDGKLKTCLHSNEEVDLKKILRENGDIKQAILNAVKCKPDGHKLEDGNYIKRDMVKVGG